jgi:hypothetical protein
VQPLVPRYAAVTTCVHSHLFINNSIFRIFEQATDKAKRAETVSIPNDAVPGMDTNSREFRKVILVENAKVGNPSGKCACTEPPFIGGLAELQSLQNSFFLNFLMLIFIY